MFKITCNHCLQRELAALESLIMLVSPRLKRILVVCGRMWLYPCLWVIHSFCCTKFQISLADECTHRALVRLQGTVYRSHRAKAKTSSYTHLWVIERFPNTSLFFVDWQVGFPKAASTSGMVARFRAGAPGPTGPHRGIKSINSKKTTQLNQFLKQWPILPWSFFSKTYFPEGHSKEFPKL